MLNLSEVQLRLINANNRLRVFREDVKPLNEKILFWEEELERLRGLELELQEEIETEEEKA